MLKQTVLRTGNSAYGLYEPQNSLHNTVRTVSVQEKPNFNGMNAFATKGWYFPDMQIHPFGIILFEDIAFLRRPRGDKGPLRCGPWIGVGKKESSYILFVHKFALTPYGSPMNGIDGLAVWLADNREEVIKRAKTDCLRFPRFQFLPQGYNELSGRERQVFCSTLDRALAIGK